LMVGEVVEEGFQCKFDTCSVFEFKPSANQADLGDGKLTLMCLFEHARVQSTSQLGWATFNIVENIKLVQLNTPVRIRFAVISSASCKKVVSR
jgi:hypothetical protein